jgi:hypothetical protein
MQAIQRDVFEFPMSSVDDPWRMMLASFTLCSATGAAAAAAAATVASCFSAAAVGFTV